MIKSFLLSSLILGLIHFIDGVAIDTDSAHEGNTIVIPRGYTRQEYLKSIVDFWTPERMASAKPLHPIISRDDATSISSKIEINKPEKILSEAIEGPNSRSSIPSALGRAFFVMDGLTYVCSGSVIRSDNHDTIVTAGHCVYNTTSKKYATNWIFKPQYNHTEGPPGTFVWRFMKASNVWEQKLDYNHDVAIVLMHPNERGVHIQDAAGAFGLTLNAPKRAHTNAFGYPMNINNGETMSTCADNSVDPNLLLMGYFKGLQITCGMGGGASGGPWLQTYNPDHHSGQQISLTSFSYTFAPGKIHGPHFTDDNIGVLFNQYQNA